MDIIQAMNSVPNAVPGNPPILWVSASYPQQALITGDHPNHPLAVLNVEPLTNATTRGVTLMLSDTLMAWYLVTWVSLSWKTHCRIQVYLATRSYSMICSAIILVKPFWTLITPSHPSRWTKLAEDPLWHSVVLIAGLWEAYFCNWSENRRPLCRNNGWLERINQLQLKLHLVIPTHFSSSSVCATLSELVQAAPFSISPSPP